MSEADAHTQDTFKLTSATFLPIIVNSKNEPFSDVVVAYNLCSLTGTIHVGSSEMFFTSFAYR